METQHTPDITTGFIQMVEAYKAKPELEAKINELQSSLSNRESEAERRERRIAELESQLNSASADKERLTRERDEAMFRSLELEEKTSAVSDLVAKLEGLVRPEPVAKVETAPEQSVEQAPVEQGSVSEPYAHEDRFQHEDRPSNIEDFRPAYSGQGQQAEDFRPGSTTYAPNWDNPNKEQQNAEGSSSASESVAVSEPPRHENHGKPYDQKPWWVNDNDWRSQGGQGPHEGGSWQAPWEQRA